MNLDCRAEPGPFIVKFIDSGWGTIALELASICLSTLLFPRSQYTAKWVSKLLNIFLEEEKNLYGQCVPIRCTW